MIACWYSTGLVIERLRVRIPAGAAGEFSSPELTFCADSYSVSVPPPCYRSGTQKITVILPKVQVAGYVQTRIHPCPSEVGVGRLSYPLLHGAQTFLYVSFEMPDNTAVSVKGMHAFVILPLICVLTRFRCALVLWRSVDIQLLCQQKNIKQNLTGGIPI